MTQKILLFITNNYDIRIQQVKICFKLLALFLFSLSKAGYYKIIWRHIHLITAGYLPKITSLCVSILCTRTLQLTKIEK